MTQQDSLIAKIDEGWQTVMTSEEAIENMRYAAQSESDAQKQATAWFAFDTAAAEL